MSNLQEQESRTEAARREADARANEAATAWDLWSYARTLESRAFEAYLVEIRKLKQMREAKDD